MLVMCGFIVGLLTEAVKETTDVDSESFPFVVRNMLSSDGVGRQPPK